MIRRIFCAASVLLSACVASPPRIGGVPGAPPAPASFWTPPAALAREQEARAATDAPTALAPAALQQLSLANVVDIALRNNPATHLSWSQARAVADEYGAARGLLYPTVNAGVSVSRAQNVTSNAVDRTQYGPSVTLSYLVLDFGGRNGSIESARQTAIAADFAHNATVQNTILNAESAAFTYLATLSLRDAQRAAVDEAAANLTAAEERHRVGLATIADVLQARTARAQEELNFETLKGQVQVTRGTLAAAMGLPVTAPIEVPGINAPDSATVRAASQTVDSIISLAVRNRPDLAAASADAARAAAEVRIARSAGRPALSFIASGGYVGSDVSTASGRTYALNFGLSMPLFTGFANEYGVRAASAFRDAANAQTQVTRQQITVEVFAAYYALQTAADRVRTSADLLSSASESEQVARGRYNEGVGSIVDLLIAQSALANARAQSIGARWQWRTALAQLAHDAGVLGLHGESLVPLASTPGNNR